MDISLQLLIDNHFIIFKEGFYKVSFDHFASKQTYTFSFIHLLHEHCRKINKNCTGLRMTNFGLN